MQLLPLKKYAYRYRNGGKIVSTRSYVLMLLLDFVAFLSPDHNFGTSCHMTYANATHYLLLKSHLKTFNFRHYMVK